MTETTRPSDAPLRGIALMCVAVFFMVCMAATTKHLNTIYSPTQLIWARFFFNLVLIYALFPGHARRMFVSRNVGWQLSRSTANAFAGALFVIALRHISIAELVAITNTAPILITVFAALFLKERLRVLLALTGLLGGVAHFFIIRFGGLDRGVRRFGAAVVALSGIYVLLRETKA